MKRIIKLSIVPVMLPALASCGNKEEKKNY